MNKVYAFLFQLLEFLLAHSPAHHIRLAQREARQRLEYLHNLLLIHHAAIGNRQNRFQQRVFIGHPFRMQPALRIPRDVLHRPRTVQRYDSCDVFNRLRMKVDYNISHSARFQLEYPHGTPLPKHLIGCLIFQRNLVYLEIRNAALHHLFRVCNDRQVTQTQKVHFQQAKLLQRDHGKLCYRLTIVNGQRNVGINRLPGNDHARRVSGSMTRHPFQSTGSVDQFFDPGVPVVHLPQLGIGFKRLVNGNMQFHRYLLGDCVYLIIWNIQRTPNVAYRSPRGHCTKSHNLCDTVRTVFFGDVLDHLRAAHIAEININIRHRNAFRIQETFKVKVIRNRVKVRNIKAVRNNRACRRTTPRADRNTVALCITDEIGNNQEIIYKSHLRNHIKLILQALTNL